LDTRLFTFLLSNAGRVSVPGEGQKARLIDLGIADDRVVVVVNSCESEVLKPESVHAKHNPGPSPGRPVHVLYLSSLIDTKGYPEFLEAIRRAASWGGPRIEAVLCGQISPSEFSERFNDPAVAEAWIEGEVAAINRGARSKIRWIRGATGSEKAALLREADIFVLPTRYAVESQPVALLEAMASGCAIVTTPAGEIPTILDKECAILLPAASVEAVEEALQLLTTSPNRRASLAAAANRRFVERYSLDRHIDAWEKLLDGMAGGRRERRAVAAT
jgi:glycosyltransferase involved in cell wall biosynthesis